LFALAAIVLLIAREAGVVSFELPTPRRQTVGQWFQLNGIVTAAAMWGADIGFGFTTWIAFGGLWALTVSCIASGEPFLGLILLPAYWVGRVLPLLFVPFFAEVRRGAELVGLVRGVGAQRGLLHRIHFVGLAALVAIQLIAFVASR
jgi:hypothetical protein